MCLTGSSKGGHGKRAAVRERTGRRAGKEGHETSPGKRGQIFLFTWERTWSEEIWRGMGYGREEKKVWTRMGGNQVGKGQGSKSAKIEEEERRQNRDTLTG